MGGRQPEGEGGRERWVGGSRGRGGGRVPAGVPGGQERAGVAAAGGYPGEVRGRRPAGSPGAQPAAPAREEAPRQAPGTARPRRGRCSSRAAVSRGCRSGGSRAGAVRRRPPREAAAAGRQRERPRTARRSPAGPSRPVPVLSARPWRGPAAAAPPNLRGPRLRAASATRSAPSPRPQPGRGDRPGLPRFPVPRSLTLAGAAVAVLAVGQVVQHGAGCPRPHAAARELRAPRSAASRVPAPPPAVAGGRGLQCGGARGSRLAAAGGAQPGRSLHHVCRRHCPRRCGEGSSGRQGRGGGGRGAERTPPPG